MEGKAVQDNQSKVRKRVHEGWEVRWKGGVEIVALIRAIACQSGVAHLRLLPTGDCTSAWLVGFGLVCCNSHP